MLIIKDIGHHYFESFFLRKTSFSGDKSIVCGIVIIVLGALLLTCVFLVFLKGMRVNAQMAISYKYK